MEIGMNRWTKKIFTISLVIGLGQVSADANFLDLKKHKQAPVKSTPAEQPNPFPKYIYHKTSHKTEVVKKSISLRFENLSLINVLQNIQEETGISFSTDPELETVPFSATVKAENWETAVKLLLKDFSRIEVWTDNLNTSRVWLYQGR